MKEENYAEHSPRLLPIDVLDILHKLGKLGRPDFCNMEGKVSIESNLLFFGLRGISIHFRYWLYLKFEAVKHEYQNISAGLASMKSDTKT